MTLVSACSNRMILCPSPTMPCFVLFRYRSVLFSSLCFQERWHQLQTPSSGKTVQHSLVLLGGPGTGKTHMLKLAISLQHCFFPKTTQQCAFMNSAARLINGRTLHSALHLPNGSWTPSSRGLGKEKDKILAAWQLGDGSCYFVLMRFQWCLLISSRAPNFAPGKSSSRTPLGAT